MFDIFQKNERDFDKMNLSYFENLCHIQFKNRGRSNYSYSLSVVRQNFEKLII